MLMTHVLCANIDIVIIEIKKLNEDFENICAWFVDNKLSIHFEDDQTK